MPRFNLDDYITVQDRINRFWSENPNGRIETNLVSLPDQFDQVVFVARVYTDASDPHPRATGWDAEVAGTSERDGANYGAHHANAETSAIGRALANYGFAKNAGDRPSREEMEKVGRVTIAGGEQAARPSGPPINQGLGPTPRQIEYIEKLADDKGILDALQSYSNQWYGTNVESLSRADASAMIDKLKDFVAYPSDGEAVPTPFEQGPVNRALVQPGSNAESGMNEGARKFWTAKIVDAKTQDEVVQISDAIQERFGSVDEDMAELLFAAAQRLGG